MTLERQLQAGRLDQAATLAVDRSGMIAGVGLSNAQIAAVRGRAGELELLFPPEAIANVCICAMGGSAVAADLIVSAFYDKLRRPVATHRGYYLPGWVGEDTLVVLVSYSGETEETLTAAMEAMDRGCLAVGISTGGKLGDWYPERGVPVVRIPGGLQPRAALLSMMVPLLEILARCGVLPDMTAEIDDAIRVADAAVAAYGPQVPEADNPAKRIAMALDDHLPVIWGGEMTAAVALRWKAQINENTEVPAYWGVVPEVNHNEIVGFGGIGEAGARTALVMLRDPHQHRQVQRRFEVAAELLDPMVGAVLTVTAEGDTALGRMLDLVLLGDYVSLYMACLRGVDPTPIALIQALKDRLAMSGNGRVPGSDGAA